MTGISVIKPIKGASLRPLPLGAIKPAGWLHDQLLVQASGLSGHLDEFWPSLKDSRWIGGASEGWERGPYWLDGLIPLAVLLGDTRLMDKARYWVDYILAHQHSDGWMGDTEDPHAGGGGQHPRLDPWPQFVLFKALGQWQEATGDVRVVPALLRAARRIADLLATEPLQSWAKMRWFELCVGVLWLHDRTGEAWLLDLCKTVERQGYDWQAHFADFRYTGKSPEWKQENHVVNHTMAWKAPALRALFSTATGDTSLWRDAAEQCLAVMDRYHGQITGMISGDESVAGLSPSQGTELCAVVEAMYSLYWLVGVFGSAPFADRLERIAFNALPATFTPDMWAHQYVQQVNQAVCKTAPDGERVYTNNGPDANLFGLEPNFGCCTANLHQGWPKLTSHLWMKTDNGLCAVAYGPCKVTTTLADGRRMSIEEKTEYPFRDTIQFQIETSDNKPARFPLRLRVPEWATGATLTIGGESKPLAPGRFHDVERDWRHGETATLHLPLTPRIQTRPAPGGRSLWRGPLLFSLRIGERFRETGKNAGKPYADREVLPETPWNYALDEERSVFTVREFPLSHAQPWNHDKPPVALSAPARRVPSWTLEKNAAQNPPVSPLPANAVALETETIELIPYGATRLRITEFPHFGAEKI